MHTDTQTIQPSKIVHFSNQTGRYFSNLPGNQEDDYVPLSDYEALARELAARTELTAGSLSLSVETRVVRWNNGKGIKLSLQECELLAYLLRRPSETIPFATLAAEAWSGKAPTSISNLHVYVTYLRRKLQQAGAPTLIYTERSTGFRLVPCDADYIVALTL
jgi:DNA-binding response OmpR family regulator